MKLSNGYGSVYKKKGNRRRPYVAIITTGYTINGCQKRKVIGYAKTSSEALELLHEYHKRPYDLNYKDITFEQLCDEVFNDLEKLIKEEKMSESNLKGLQSVYKNHLTSLYREKIVEIKFKQMQNIIDNTNLGVTAKGNIKTVCVKAFNKAIEEYELPILKNPAIGLKIGSKEVSNKHIPFSKEELSILWGLQENDLVKTIIILCYTGLRPNELFITKKENIYLKEKYFITGSKTKAGKDRIIPIHSKIKHLIRYFYDKDEEYPFKKVFTGFNYNKLSRESKKLFINLNFNHTPYDGRHTFSTMMKEAGANEYLLKRIMGHSIQDITENVYTHRSIEDLIREVEKIK